MKVKSLSDPKSAKAHIDFLKHAGFPYTLKVSNYTLEIVSDIINIQFLHSMRSNRCFAAYAKIKSNVSKHEIPKVKKHELEYFMHDFTDDYFSENAINIDIKSAYPSVLFNDGYITQETFDYLSKIPKLDRLAAIGMLASKKYVFDYDGNGKLLNFDKVTSPLENFFFHCVKRVGDIMHDLKKLSGSDYLFTWVDGIYLKPNDEYLYEVAPHLEANGFKYSVDIIQKFNVKILAGKIKIDFWKEDQTKDGSDICKQKFFVIPPAPSMFANDIINYLTGQNFNDEKNSGITPAIQQAADLRRVRS
jgi:hypothetical protein